MHFLPKNVRPLRLSIGLCLMLGVAVSANAQLRRADRKFDRFLYAQAVPLYKKAIEKYPENGQIVEKLGDTYRLLNDSHNAEIWFEKAVKAAGGRPENFLYYGQALMNNRRWEAAVPVLQQYVALKGDDPIGQNALRSAQNYQRFMQDSTMYKVNHLDINSIDADFGTSYFDKDVIYASAKREARFIFGWTGRPFLDLYKAEMEGLKLNNPNSLKGKVNSRYHEGGQTVSPDGKVMFFSRNNYDKGRVRQSQEGVIRLKTFRAELKNGRWIKVKEFPFNSNEYSMGHPALSADGKTLYFVSDKPGGEGGTDLYSVSLDIAAQSWGTPVNLGSKINTKGNEMFPWMSPEGDLYFASNGHEGLGGLDIFYIRNFQGGGTEIKNIGYPINSPKDDFALIYDANLGNGFFSSNRVGGTGDDDIYGFLKRKALHGIVVDAATGQPIENARVELIGGDGVPTVAMTDPKGDFMQGINPNGAYQLVVNKAGYKEAVTPLRDLEIAPDGQVVVRVPMQRAEDCNPSYTLAGLVHDNGGKPQPGTKVRIITKEIVAVTDANGEIHVPLAPDQDYLVLLEEPTGKGKSYDVTTKGLPNGSEVPLDMNINLLDTGKVFYIIYYNFDKHDIREGDARPELDRVVNFMLKHPLVKVRLTSHTDSRATDAYNQQLSQNRAIEAYSYIVNHGVDKSRLSYDWKGERVLTNGCADGVECTEEEHQRNRRTEFRFDGAIVSPK